MNQPRKALPIPKQGVECKFYVSIDKPECGTQATAYIRVKTRTGETLVPLCSMHKARHDDIEMQRRLARKNRNRSSA